MAMEQIEVKILDRTFKLQVPPNEKPRLMNAVRIVDQKMREIRDASLAHGVERIAVNAALQITYEFLGPAGRLRRRHRRTGADPGHPAQQRTGRRHPPLRGRSLKQRNHTGRPLIGGRERDNRQNLPPSTDKRV